MLIKYNYSCSTTASVFDAIANILKKYRNIPSIIFIRDYADNMKYIHALKKSITNSFNKHGNPDRLILSFHGIPKKYIEDGDDYLERCKITKKLLTSILDYPEEKIIMSFQSKFGNIMNRSIEVFSRSDSTFSTYKTLRNTYLLLSITTAFSALIATISSLCKLPYLGAIPTLVGFYALLFLVNYLSNKKSGILATFALTGFMGYAIAPIINVMLAINSSNSIILALSGTAMEYLEE
uniref:Ferrochelatase n=1 Tax=Glossina pallidipes TaxID=7398 RepID=A0A1A9Z0V3_GLOPL